MFNTRGVEGVATLILFRPCCLSFIVVPGRLWGVFGEAYHSLPHGSRHTQRATTSPPRHATHISRLAYMRRPLYIYFPHIYKGKHTRVSSASEVFEYFSA